MVYNANNVFGKKIPLLEKSNVFGKKNTVFGKKSNVFGEKKYRFGKKIPLLKKVTVLEIL